MKTSRPRYFSCVPISRLLLTTAQATFRKPSLPYERTNRPAYAPVPNKTRDKLSGEPATSSASPLALLFQPLIADEDVTAEDQEDNQNSRKAPNLSSYSPTSRKRLVSLGPRRHGCVRLWRHPCDFRPELVATSRHNTACPIL